MSLQCTLENESITFQFIAIENQVIEALTLKNCNASIFNLMKIAILFEIKGNFA
jgi:hypothetical protein